MAQSGMPGQLLPRISYERKYYGFVPTLQHPISEPEITRIVFKIAKNITDILLTKTMLFTTTSSKRRLS